MVIKKGKLVQFTRKRSRRYLLDFQQNSARRTKIKSFMVLLWIATVKIWSSWKRRWDPHIWNLINV